MELSGGATFLLRNTRLTAIPDAERRQFEYVMRGLSLLKNQVFNIMVHANGVALSFEAHLCLNEAIFRLTPIVLAVYLHVEKRESPGADAVLLHWDGFSMALTVVFGEDVTNYAIGDAKRAVALLDSTAPHLSAQRFASLSPAEIELTQSTSRVVLDIINIGRHLITQHTGISCGLVVAIAAVVEFVAAEFIELSGTRAQVRDAGDADAGLASACTGFKVGRLITTEMDVSWVLSGDDAYSIHFPKPSWISLRHVDTLDDWTNRLLVCSELLREELAIPKIATQTRDDPSVTVRDPLNWCLFELEGPAAALVLRDIDDATLTCVPDIPIPCCRFMVRGPEAWRRRKHAVAAWQTAWT